MPNLSDLTDNFARLGPQSFWEAMGMLARIQDEQEQATREGDVLRLQRLLSEQAVAWSYARAFVLQLIERGEAPQGMVERLREVLRIHRRREQELIEAKERLREKLQRAREILASQEQSRAA